MTTIDTSFKDQFNLVKGGNTNNNFINNKYSYLDAPSTYGTEPVTPQAMHPFNYMDRFKDGKATATITNVANRRDNTIIINDYHTKDVGQYATPKKEINYLFEPVENLNALAGDTKIVDKISANNRYLDTLQYKTNEFPANTNIRPELIDGVPLTEVVRPREKSLEERRGLGINSQRLDPNGRTNETGYDGHGTSTDPSTINITKYKMPTYRIQDNPEDLLKTTGVITRPEWRSMVKEPSTDRSFMKNMEGPAMATVMKPEFQNDQAARPTVKEETIVNNYLSNAFTTVTKEEFRNEQAANPTQRMDYLNDQRVIGVKSLIDQNTYRNQQALNPTIRMDYQNDERIIGVKALVDQNTYRNEQALNPTIRMDYQNDERIIGVKALVDQNTYRNQQSANPTIRMDYQNDQRIIGNKAFVEQLTYRNEQPANPTNRMDQNKYISHGNNINAGYVYENQQPANPTQRMDQNKYISHGNNVNVGYVYENFQPANPTNRTDENPFIGAGYNQTNSSYKKYGDITRSGFVEETLAKDYMGAETAFVPRAESHEQTNNMKLNESIEASINLTKRDLMGGGTDRIPQGKENIGEYVDWNRREAAQPISNRVRNVAVSYIQEVPETRGYNLLQERSPINPNIPASLAGNPFVNNINYVGKNYSNDVVREFTELSDREISRGKKQIDYNITADNYQKILEQAMMQIN